MTYPLVFTLKNFNKNDWWEKLKNPILRRYLLLNPPAYQNFNKKASGTIKLTLENRKRYPHIPTSLINILTQNKKG